jgi:F420-dependent oxidoreductase-like protein
MSLTEGSTFNTLEREFIEPPDQPVLVRVSRERRRAMKVTAVLLATMLLASAAFGDATPAASGRRVKFGVQTTNQDFTYEELVAAWKDVESLGFDSAWLFDHFIPILGANEDGPCLEGWTALSALAAETTKIRIGTLVTGNTYRNPALLAKMATTVDIVSKGRLDLGIGAAWAEREHEAYGFPFYTPKVRAQRLDEALQVIRKLWTEDHPSFDGKFYTLKNAPFAPKPVQQPHPPIVIGGQGEKWIMPLVGRYADGWNVPIGLSPEDIAKRLTIVRETCGQAGRADCADIEVSAFLVLYSISDIPLAGPVLGLASRMIAGDRVQKSLLAGSPEAIRKKIQTYVDAGVTHVIMNIQPPYDGKMMRRFASEVMPSFR